MKNYFLLFLFSFFTNVFSQKDLNYFLENAYSNSPQLNEIKNSVEITNLQNQLDIAQNSAIQSDVTANYLFSPYFNNNGKLISANPDPKAIGYDVGITNGGLYSAQLNFSKNIFTSGLTSALKNQNEIKLKQSDYNYDLEKRNLTKQIIDQYLITYKSLKLFKLSNDPIKLLKDQIDITTKLVEQGFAKIQDYLLLKIELKSLQNTYDENYQTYKNDLLQLNSLSGIKDTSIVFIDSVNVKIKNTNPNFSFLEKYKLDSLGILSQQNLFETKYNPKVELFFNAGLNAVELNNLQRKFGLSAGINFQLPILDGGQKDITQQQNKIALNSISNYRMFAKLNIQNQNKNALSKINLLKQSISNLNLQLQDYQQLIKLTGNQIKTGDITMIEYLTILQNYIDLRKSRIEKEIDLQTEINNYNYWNE